MSKSIQKKAQYPWLSNIRAQVLLKLIFVGVFIFLGAITFVYFTRSTQDVEVRLFLTEREWAKTWENYPDGFFIEQLQPGMVEKDELGRVEAEVVDVLSNRLPYTHNVAFATLRLRANYNKRTQTY